MLVLAEDPDLQERLRSERGLIPGFIEEVLRVESPIRATSRISRCPVHVGDTEIPRGSVVTLVYGAANRDPDRFPDPDRFDPDRVNARENLAFGRGLHMCPGAPLARTESRIALESMLDRMADIRISEAHHGPPDDRHVEWTDWYLLRGPARPHLEFTPI